MIPEIFQFSCTPVLSTSPAYSNADVLFDTTFIQSFVKRGRIISALLLDKDAQSETGQMLFFKNNVSLGTINAGPSITDANAEEIVGYITWPTNLQLVANRINFLSCDIPFDLAGGTGLYVAGITGSTGTHTASGIVISIRIEKRY